VRAFAHYVLGRKRPSHIFSYHVLSLLNCGRNFTLFNFAKIWGGISLTNSFEDWIKVEKCFKTLPILVCWQVWLERNTCIFENHTPSIMRACIKVREMVNSTIGLSLSRTQPRIKKLQILVGITFVGLMELHNKMVLLCGVGGVIKTPGMTTYRWTLNCGQGQILELNFLGFGLA
jgi:hypothetical protein